MYFKRLRELREDNDLTQETIAKLIKTTQENYQRYESGKRNLPIEHAITLARFYNVTIDYLVGEE